MKKRLAALCLALALVLGLVPASAAAAYTEMSYSDGLVQYIKDHEGFRANVYSDGTGYYIGYGTSCNYGDYPGGISEEKAEELLRGKMDLFADAVNAFLQRNDASVTLGQFDALCGLAYNLGTSWLNTSNRLPYIVVSGPENYSEMDIVNAFAVYCHVGSAVWPALIERRIIEAKMFLYDDYGAGSAPDYDYIIPDARGGDIDSDVYCYKVGESYGSLPTASMEGYTFAGWEKEDGNLLSENDRVSGNLRLKAVWTRGETSPVPPTEPAVPETPEIPEVPENAPLIFSDLVKDEWYYPYVYSMVEKGVINGFDDGTFRPDNDITYAEALVLLTLASGFSQQGLNEDGHWAQNYLDFFVKNSYVREGVITDLDAPISRYEIADLAAAALELSATEGMENPYADTDRKSALALYAVSVMVGSIEGGERFFKGESYITRAEMSTVAYMMYRYVEEEYILFNGFRIEKNDELRLNTVDESLYYADGDKIYYDGDAVYGIDVSYYQGDVDWQAVKAQGYDYVIIRVGYRGYGNGSLNEDVRFREYIRGAEDAGLDVGVYFFSQAISVEEAVEEADFVLERIEGHDIKYPVVFDFEPQDYTGSRTEHYDPEVLTDCAVAFSERVKAAGYIPMIYASRNMAYRKFDLTRLQDYDFWLASYRNRPEYYYGYDMWQYGSRHIDGIDGLVDMNICHKSY